MTTCEVIEERVHIPNSMQIADGQSGSGVVRRKGTGKTFDEAKANMEKQKPEGDNKGFTPVVMIVSYWVKRGCMSQLIKQDFS